MEHTIKELQMLQALPLKEKVEMTRERIRAWVDHFGEDKCYVSFSGGKDSTVLLQIAREMYPNIKAVFVDTGLEYPEIREFVKTFDNVEWLKPKMNFRQVIEKYGYPFISKEVSESVQGARKYLTSIVEQQKSLTDRQTDRTAIITSELLEQEHIKNIKTGKHHPYQFETSKLLGTCRLFSKSKKNEGGYDNKYRKVRGIGEYSKRTNVSENGRCKSEISNNVGMADKRHESSDTGEYP